VSEASIAFNRFGLGARPEDRPPDRPKQWLSAQFDHFVVRPPAIAAMPPGSAIAADLSDALQQARIARREAMAGPGNVPALDMQGETRAVPDTAMALRQRARREGRDYYAAAVGARAQAALVSDAPFVERLVHFWSNHFAVSADKVNVIGLTGAFEFEAIRPHVLGRFGDMLNAVERHPAMLIFLDQAQSVGPNSPQAQRAAGNGRKQGLNENLAREILELHTLGVRTGYSQADVTEFARALTGWTVAGFGATGKAGGLAPGAFAFVPRLHEPGARTILGNRYAQPGEAQAEAVLQDVAVHPATAQHIATKLSRHFAGDDPPPAMVAHVQAAFLKSGGDLPSVYQALLAAPEAWVPQPVKFKTPWEWAISAHRALGARTVDPQAMFGLLNQLGQPIWKPGSPAGYDDIAASWAGPDAVLRRVEAAERLASRSREAIDARERADMLFPGALGDATRQALARAESPSQALALMLVAPEFMRR
jgi:uncharacterized protein (DUF1800 family)